jgi:hypothetical protein
MLNTFSHQGHENQSIEIHSHPRVENKQQRLLVGI